MFLDCRANEVVCDSSGKPRADTGGGATRRLFMQLPGVGAKTAKIWYDLGFRCVFSLLNCILVCWRPPKTYGTEGRENAACAVGVMYAGHLLTLSLTKGELGHIY